MASQDIEPIHFGELLDGKTDEKSRFLGALFLFFLFLISFLFLYFIYVCVHRRAGYFSSHRSQNGRAPPPKGLDSATIRDLPIFSYGCSSLNNKKNRSSPEAECSICLALFQEGEKVKVVPQCHHGFHSECVDKWLTTHSTCPLCRNSILIPGSSADPEVT